MKFPLRFIGLVFLASVSLIQFSAPTIRAVDAPPAPPEEEVPLEPPPPAPAPNEQLAPRPKFDQTVSPPPAPEEQIAPPPEADAPTPLTDDPPPTQNQPQIVPQEQPEQEVAPPAAAPELAFSTSQPDPDQFQVAIPHIEVWRSGGKRPQVPAFGAGHFDQVLIAPGESLGDGLRQGPPTIVLHFDPALAGHSLQLTPGTGVILHPEGSAMPIGAGGECVLQAELAQGVTDGEIGFYVDGVSSILPVALRALETVFPAEQASLGGQ